MIKNFILALCASILLAGCQSSTIVEPVALDLPDRTELQRNDNKRIAPLDTLSINVFAVNDLDGQYQVDAFGDIKFPLIGTFRAAGYTSAQVSEQIEGKLAANYLQNPDVTVSIAESQSEQITIEGSVNSPGIYPIAGDMTLLQAIALSGGPDEFANTDRVAIFRQIDGERQAAVYDLRAIRQQKMEDPAVYGNDIVVVDGNETQQGYREFLRSVPLLALFFVY